MSCSFCFGLKSWRTAAVESSNGMRFRFTLTFQQSLRHAAKSFPSTFQCVCDFYLLLFVNKFWNPAKSRGVSKTCRVLENRSTSFSAFFSPHVFFRVRYVPSPESLRQLFVFPPKTRSSAAHSQNEYWTWLSKRVNRWRSSPGQAQMSIHFWTQIGHLKRGKTNVSKSQIFHRVIRQFTVFLQSAYIVLQCYIT